VDLPDNGDCIFCKIVNDDAPANWVSRPSEGLKVSCFHNRLKWERVMLLIVPDEHMTQSEFWSSPVLNNAAKLAVKVGDAYCAEDGYRVISNFGRVAHQSQVHAHLHVVSGASTQVQNASAPNVLSENGATVVTQYEIPDSPTSIGVSVEDVATQRDLYEGGQILEAADAAMTWGAQNSSQGFRLLSSFNPASDQEPKPGMNENGLFLLGGGQLGLYV
jgi:diadenosine tetraphosphate (Ap4A) HIT family hydrolase